MTFTPHSFGHARTTLRRTAALTALALLAGTGWAAPGLTEFVTPWMGVVSNGNTVIGPQMPWGSIHPSPDTPDGYTDGYNPANKIRGFSQLHVTGTGGPGKYGQFLVSPQIGLNVNETGHDSGKADETPRASRYAVRLTDYDIRCELAPTRHAAIYRFAFPQSDNANLVVDLGHNIPLDSDFFKGGYADEGEVVVDKEHQRISGWGHYWGGWSAEPFSVYFAARYSRPSEGSGTWKDGAVQPDSARQSITEKKQRIGCYLKFKTAAAEPILFKIAVSFVSVEQAERYLNAEIPAWDFDRTAAECDAAWNRQLEKIGVEGATPDQKLLFYTSLYNAMRMPRDRTGDNPKWKSAEPYWDDHYCVWDTWKTVFPLHVLLNESVVRDNVRAFLDRFAQNGQILDAFIAGNDRYHEWYGDTAESWLINQGGDNVNNVIADACVKGVSGIDWKACYRYLKDSADRERAPSYRANMRGWVPYRGFAFGLYCSRSLEFAYNDFCVSQVAQHIGEAADAQAYAARSRGWENLWNPAAESDGFKGFVAPRKTDGTWVPYDPKKDQAEISRGGLDRCFYEGSSWVYSYFIPHDYARLIALSGGAEAYVKKLQHALEAGLIDFGNEPSFLTPYSLIYAGRPDLTSFWVRKNMANYTRDGFPGDEDSGAMGSWYVFAALGFFPNAGQDLYLLNGPLFAKAVLRMENGKALVVEGVDASSEHPYVQSATLNGAPLNRAWLRHGEIKDGSTLKFVMGSKPSEWGRGEPPPSPFGS